MLPAILTGGNEKVCDSCDILRQRPLHCAAVCFTAALRLFTFLETLKHKPAHGPCSHQESVPFIIFKRPIPEACEDYRLPMTARPNEQLPMKDAATSSLGLSLVNETATDVSDYQPLQNPI